MQVGRTGAPSAQRSTKAHPYADPLLDAVAKLEQLRRSVCELSRKVEALVSPLDAPRIRGFFVDERLAPLLVELDCVLDSLDFASPGKTITAAQSTLLGISTSLRRLASPIDALESLGRGHSALESLLVAFGVCLRGLGTRRQLLDAGLQWLIATNELVCVM
jgi:hypothetical protein